MKGSKQCPQCECTDVPVNAEVCPFCGYEFVKPTVAEPKVKQKKPAVKLAEEKKPTEVKGISKGEKEGTGQETGSQSIVAEGTAIPESTEYRTYQKKGIIKQTAAGTAPQEQGKKAAIGWLAAALVVAVLFLTCQYLAKMMTLSIRMEYLVWSCIAGGVLYGFLHVCCYANEKGSRGAGILGIVLGFGGMLYLCAQALREAYGLPLSNAFGNAYSLYGRRFLISIIIYVICWFTAAKLTKNSKRYIAFCLTAAELVLLPYLGNWMLYQARPQIINWQFAATCAAMLVTDFLLFRIKAWLAVKPRKLFWVAYAIIMFGTLVAIYSFRHMLYY